jgi:hypothetical protein
MRIWRCIDYYLVALSSSCQSQEKRAQRQYSANLGPPIQRTHMILLQSNSCQSKETAAQTQDTANGDQIGIIVLTTYIYYIYTHMAQLFHLLAGNPSGALK